VDEEDFTATAFMNADNVGNQIASFYPGSGADAQKVDVTEAASNAGYAIISAGDPGAMVQHTEQIAATDCKLVYDPAFQIVILSAEQIARGIELADIVIGNDYEFGMMTNKTGLSVDDIATRKPMTVITFGGRGSEIRANGESHMIPVATPRQFGDPTGGGDAYRAGLVAGLLIGADLPVAGRMAALTSTHAIEYHGPQEHVFTPASFVERFDEAFPDFAGAVSANALRDLQQNQNIGNNTTMEV
jgi:adenosine kinase